MAYRSIPVLLLLVLMLPYFQQVMVPGKSSDVGFASPRIPDVERILVGSGVVDADLDNGILLVIGGFGAKLYSVNGSLMWSGVENETTCKGALLGGEIVAIFTSTGLEVYNTSSGGLLWVDPGYGCPSLVDGSNSGVLAIVRNEGGRERSTLELIGVLGAWRKSVGIGGIVTKIEWSPSGDMVAVLYEAKDSEKRNVIEVLNSKGLKLYESPSNVSVYDFAWGPGNVLALAMGAHGVLLVEPGDEQVVKRTFRTMFRAYSVTWLNESSLAVLDHLSENYAIIDIAEMRTAYGVLPLRMVIKKPRIWNASNGFIVTGILLGDSPYSKRSLIARVKPSDETLVFYNTVEGRVLSLAEANESLIVATSSGLYRVGEEYVVEKTPTSIEFREIEARATAPGLVLVVYSSGGPIGERVLEAISTETGTVLWRRPVPPIGKLEPSPDRQYAALIAKDGCLYVISLEKGEVLWALDGGVRDASWSESGLIVARKEHRSSILEKYAPSGKLLASVRISSQLIGDKLLASPDGWVALVDGSTVYGYTPGLKEAYRIRLGEQPWRIEITRNGLLYAQLSSRIIVYDNAGHKVREISAQNSRLRSITGFAASKKSGLLAITGFSKETSNSLYMLVVYDRKGRELWSRGFDTSVTPIGWFHNDILLVYKYPPFCRPSSLIAYGSNGLELFRVKGASQSAYLDSVEDKRVVILGKDTITVKRLNESRVLEKNLRALGAVVSHKKSLLELMVRDGRSTKYIGLNASSGDAEFSVDLYYPYLFSFKPGGGAIAVSYSYCNPSTYESWSVVRVVNEKGETLWSKRFSDERLSSLGFSPLGELAVAAPSSIEAYVWNRGEHLYTIPLGRVSIEYFDNRDGLTVVVLHSFSEGKYWVRVYRSSTLLAEVVEQKPVSKAVARDGVLAYVVGSPYREEARLIVARYSGASGVEKLWEKELQNSIVGLEVMRGSVIATLSSGETLVYDASRGAVEEAIAPLYTPFTHASWRKALYALSDYGLEGVVLNKPLWGTSLLMAEDVGVPFSSDILLYYREGGSSVLVATSRGVFRVKLLGGHNSAILEGIPVYADAESSRDRVSIFYDNRLVWLEPTKEEALRAFTYSLDFIPAHIAGYTISTHYLAIYNYREIAIYTRSVNNGYRLLSILHPSSRDGGWIRSVSIYEQDSVMAVFTDKVVHLYRLPDLRLEAGIWAPRGYSVRGGELRSGVLVVLYAKYTVVEKTRSSTILRPTGIAVGMYSYSGEEKTPLILFNATGVNRAEWVSPTTYLVALLGDGVYAISIGADKPVKLYESGEKLLWAIGLGGKGYALGVYDESNRTRVLVFSPSGGIRANYTLGKMYPKLLSSSQAKLLLQDGRGVLGILDASNGALEELQKAPPHLKEAVWSGGREALIVAEDARVLKLQCYSVVAFLYGGEPVNLAAGLANGPSFFKKSVDKGFKLFVSRGDWVFVFNPLEPRRLRDVIGDPEWYTRLRYLVPLSTHSYEVHVLYTPGTREFLSLVGKLVIMNVDPRSSYKCSIAWGLEAGRQSSLEPGGKIVAKALPGEYRVKCTRSAGETLGATSASVKQERTTTVLLNCTVRETGTNKTITKTIVRTLTRTQPITRTITIYSEKTTTLATTLAMTETVTINNTVTRTTTLSTTRAISRGGLVPWQLIVMLVIGLAIGYLVSKGVKARRNT